VHVGGPAGGEQRVAIQLSDLTSQPKSTRTSRASESGPNVELLQPRMQASNLGFGQTPSEEFTQVRKKEAGKPQNKRGKDTAPESARAPATKAQEGKRISRKEG